MFGYKDPYYSLIRIHYLVCKSNLSDGNIICMTNRSCAVIFTYYGNTFAYYGFICYHNQMEFGVCM